MINFKFSGNNVFTFSDDRRSRLLKINIFCSFFIKGISISISLLLVPLTLHCLSAYEYGVWLTLSSIFTWINYFDIGLGNGLRNRLAESIARKDDKLGQTYVSTTFFILSLIVIILLLVFILLQPFLNWGEILNVDPNKIANLNRVILYSFVLFCMSFLLKVTGIVYTACQKPAINDLLTLSGSLLSLIIIFILNRTTSSSLMKIAMVFSAVPVIVLMMAYPVTFYGTFRQFKPGISSVNLSYAKDLMKLGIQFFILQISGLFIFGTSNILISRILGPEEVTPFNIAFKYLSITTMVFNIILAPVWSASTDAFEKGDLVWIRNSMRRLIKATVILSFGVGVLILFANFVYRLWIGKEILIPARVSLWLGIYIIIILWSTCFSTFLFGFGKLRIQLINTVTAAILFIPLAIWLGRFMGMTGIIAALCLVNLSGAVLNPIQYYRVISGKARGIWNR